MTRFPVLTRRKALLLAGTAGIAAATPSTVLASDSIKTGVHQETGTLSTPRSAIAKTQYGLVRGFLAGGVFTFKGVPYGQNAGGENRWLPLKPPTPWTDEYPAFTYPGTVHPRSASANSAGKHWDLPKQERAFLEAEGTVFTKQHDVPLWVGEFGSVFNGPPDETPDRLRALNDQIGIFEQHNAHWTTWTYKDVGVMGIRICRGISVLRRLKWTEDFDKSENRPDKTEETRACRFAASRGPGRRVSRRTLARKRS